MNRTVIGVFDSKDEAKEAVDDLLKSGFPQSEVSLLSRTGEKAAADEIYWEEGLGVGRGAAMGGAAGLLTGLIALAIPGIGPIIAAGPFAAALGGAGVGAVTGGVIGAFSDIGMAEEDASIYAEAVRRGATVVAARTQEETTEKAADILDRHHAVDVAGRSRKWREAGWRGYDPKKGPLSSHEIKAERARHSVPIAEEEMKLGKRAVEKGGVRVYKHLKEEPVSRDVSLRTERITVEKRAVDRPPTEAELEAFKEGEIIFTERAEEPVVSKTARVTGEVVIGKTIEERIETVQDTVRHTEIDVEELKEEEKRPEGPS